MTSNRRVDPDATRPATPLLAVEALTTAFPGKNGLIYATNHVSFTVEAGAALGMVGESGSGKSVTCRSIAGLVQWPGEIVGGRVMYQGADILQLSQQRLAALRGKEFGFVFQDAGLALNPVLTIGAQLKETLRLNAGLGRKDARERACELLAKVGIPLPRERMQAYPHELSGGMRQRVMIAIATAASPRLLIADEPTTGLDVTVQAQILDLLSGLREETGMAVILVSHDFGVIAQFCQTVVVMYAGYAVEIAPAGQLFRSPAHPYSRDLLRAIPSMKPGHGETLATIEGQPPDLARLPLGCPYAPRCDQARRECAEVEMKMGLTASHEGYTACPMLSYSDWRTDAGDRISSA